MNITLEAIKFNHDPASATRDAFTIRKNQNEGVSTPEWQRRLVPLPPQDSPAVYTIPQISGNRITIRAQFRRQNSTVQNVEVRADWRIANVLGSVKRRNIAFSGELSNFELFELDTAQVPNNGVGYSDLTWDWFANGIFLQTTKHKIYKLLSDPKPPWGSLPNFQPPWTEVLDYACREAAGAMTDDEAAAKLCRWVHSLGRNKLQYAEAGSLVSHFTIPGMRTFRCTEFLSVLNSGALPKQRVNCTDCASILSSFANILGCNLFQSQMGDDFNTNPIQKLGFETRSPEVFSYHEVAWKFPCTKDAGIFDSSLQVDGDMSPRGGPFTPILAINVPWGDPNSGKYNFRLAAPTQDEVLAFPGRKLQRKIGGGTVSRRDTDPDRRRLLEEQYDFSSWEA